MPVVGKAPWWRRHPIRAGISLLAVTAVVMSGVLAGISWLTAPALECGLGMVPSNFTATCVGVDLNSDRISPDQPGALSALVGDIKANNESVTGSYVSIVLLLDLSPVPNVDTTSYSDIYRNVEGAITAVWQANHTDAYSQTPLGDTTGQPGIKLFLANMGSKNQDWEKAVDQIGAAAPANHITSVAGLGQSTTPTRSAATKLTTIYHLPVIGASVTGDLMNRNVNTGKLLDGFYRVAPTNTDTVVAATTYISQGLNISLDNVAIVEDMVGSDNYISTLITAAHNNMPHAREFPFTSPDLSVPSQARDEHLKGQFGYLDILLCAAHPRVVYFAGRGADIGTFATSWLDSPNCANQPLHVLTGDDGVEASTNDQVARAVAQGKTTVQYTGLASPTKWGSCPDSANPITVPPGIPDAAIEHTVYNRFQAAFTGQRACDVDKPAPADHAPLLAFPVEDLATGEAMQTHDAVGLAILAARRAGPIVTTDAFSPQLGVLQQIRCEQGAVHGASGVIQYSLDPQYHGNPIGVVLPILNIEPTKTTSTISTGWPTGGPAPTQGCGP